MYCIFKILLFSFILIVIVEGFASLNKSNMLIYDLTHPSTTSFFSHEITDKDYHSLAGFSTSLFVATFLQDYLSINKSISSSLTLSSLGIFSGIFIGLSKEEAYDRYNKGDVEYADFVYTSYGASLGGLMFCTISLLTNNLDLPQPFTHSLIYFFTTSIFLYLLNKL